MPSKSARRRSDSKRYMLLRVRGGISAEKGAERERERERERGDKEEKK